MWFLNSSPGEKCRQEARPTLWHVLKLWEAASGHPRTRGWDTRSGQHPCCRHNTGAFHFNSCFPGEEAAGDVAAGQRTAGADHDWQTESGRLGSSRQQGNSCKGLESSCFFCVYCLTTFLANSFDPMSLLEVHFTLLRGFSVERRCLCLFDSCHFYQVFFSSSCLFSDAASFDYKFPQFISFKNRQTSTSLAAYLIGKNSG